MKTIICPTCLGAKYVSSKRQGWMFARAATEECRTCEGFGEVLESISVGSHEWAESVKRFGLLAETAADSPGYIQLSVPEAREPSPEAIARAEALIRRCFQSSQNHVASPDGDATEFVPNDLRLIIA